MVLFSRLAWLCSRCSLCSTALFSGLICGAPHLIAVFCFGHWITSPRFAWIDFFWLLLQYWPLGQTNSKRFLLAFYLIPQVSFCLESSQALKSCFFIIFFVVLNIALVLCWDIAHVLWFELQVWTTMLPYVVFYAVLCLYMSVSSCVFASIRPLWYISCYSKTSKWIIGDQMES